jgi:hypothetical protein
MKCCRSLATTYSATALSTAAERSRRLTISGSALAWNAQVSSPAERSVRARLTAQPGLRSGRFTTNRLRCSRPFADQAVIAIENARLFEAEKQRTLSLAHANRVGRRAGSEPHQ